MCEPSLDPVIMLKNSYPTHYRISKGMQCLGFEEWGNGLNKNGEMLIIVEAG